MRQQRALLSNHSTTLQHCLLHLKMLHCHPEQGTDHLLWCLSGSTGPQQQHLQGASEGAERAGITTARVMAALGGDDTSVLFKWQLPGLGLCWVFGSRPPSRQLFLEIPAYFIDCSPFKSAPGPTPSLLLLWVMWECSDQQICKRVNGSIFQWLKLKFSITTFPWALVEASLHLTVLQATALCKRLILRLLAQPSALLTLQLGWEPPVPSDAAKSFLDSLILCLLGWQDFSS